MKNLILNEKEFRKKMIDSDIKTINELAAKAGVSKPTIYEYINGKSPLSAAFVRLCAYLKYSEAMSRRVYAAADLFLMPSLFEPCGLSQMIAMRYGTLPIVRETGGLKDSVQPYNRFTGEGTGFSFANFNAHEMKDAMLLAMDCYHRPDTMNALIRHAMEADFSFTKSACEYARLYLWML